MKKLITITALLFMAFTVTAQDNHDKASLFFHGSAGYAPKTKGVYELELGIKSPDGKLFFSVPGMVYIGNTRVNGIAEDCKTHMYYGFRINYILYTGKFAAVGPIATYFRHTTGREGSLHSNDFDAGLRFYKFAKNPILASAAWTITAKYLSTQTNVYNGKITGVSTLVPANRFVISIGIHGLL